MPSYFVCPWLQLSQLKQHSAVAEAEVQHLRSASPTLQQHLRPTDAAVSSADVQQAEPAGSSQQRQTGASAAADPGHLAPVNVGGIPPADVGVSPMARSHSASSDQRGRESPVPEVAELRRRLQEAESEATALRLQLQQLRNDHEATCRELDEARGVVRELRESVRYMVS
jgi:peptidoglycan hydrolase CwlO-like protein